MKKTLLLICTALSLNAFSQTIEAGASHSLFICSDSVPMSFGRNTYGQLGKGTANTTTNAPTSITSLSKVVAVSGGDRHSLFLKSDGTVWACGGNNAGQLGDSTITQRDSPIQTMIGGVMSISAGGRHSLFLKNDSTVWACGESYYGQLGDGTNITQRKPILVPGLTGIKAVSAGFGHSLFLKSDGTVWACGDNTFGTLGNGVASGNLYPTPAIIPSLSNIIAISAGYEYSLFLKSDGTVWACGNNANRVLGDGTGAYKTTPVQVNNVTGITAIRAGNYHSMFLKNDGKVWACGSNAYGEVGDGTQVMRSSPVVTTTSLSGITEMGAGDGFALFLKNTGVVWACGFNNYGQLGDGGFNNKITPILSTGVCALSVGANELTSNLNISVYPNPSTGIFQIKNDELKITAVEVYNLLGEKIYASTKNAESNVTIDISNQAKGIYFVNVYHAEKMSVQKIIVQ